MNNQVGIQLHPLQVEPDWDYPYILLVHSKGQVMDLNDIRETDIREIGEGVFRLTNGAINLDSTLTTKELREILSNLSEFVYEIAYKTKNK